jgi:rhodanese-related sulfurtransferase
MNLFQKLFSNTASVDLKQVIEAGAFLVDVRTPGEFMEGHVNGSVNIPLNTIPWELDKFKNKKNIVVFCRSGARSGQAVSLLRQNGFENIINGGSWNTIKQFVK